MQERIQNLWDRLNDSMARLASFQDRRLDPAALNERLEARARLLRTRSTGPSIQPHAAMLAYNKGGVHFGIPIEAVLEVQALDFVTPVPQAAAFIIGVIHWRGAILSLIDMGRLLGVAESGLADIHVAIVVEAAGRRLAIAGLEAEDIVGIPLDRIQPPPELPSGAAAEWILGVADQRILLKMDAILQDAKLIQL